MFAVIFDLEGQLDCTLHEAKAGADTEAARLSEKYAAERASYSASLAVQAVQLPPAYAEAPAMLAVLRSLMDHGPSEAQEQARAILFRIDYTGPRYCVDGLEYGDPDSPYHGDGQFPPFVIFDIQAQANLPGEYATRAEAEAALAMIDGTPTAQPDLAAALADLFERGSWHDDGSFVYWPDDSEPDNEGAIFTLSDIHNRHTS